MSSIADRVFAEVCLDERISDGIFRMDEEEHMNALRDYFVKKGITQEAAVHVTNRMVEGKYPDRQAYRKEDGILVTWPSPQHKAKAMSANPGKYTDQDPKPKDPNKTDKEGPKEPIKREPPVDKDEEPDTDKSPTKEPEERGQNIFPTGGNLAVEPMRGSEKPEPPPQPPAASIAPAPRTPERIAAEKEVAKQIFATDDSILTSVANPLNVSETTLTSQLNELYKQADKLGFKEAITFLTPYIKP